MATISEWRIPVALGAIGLVAALAAGGSPRERNADLSTAARPIWTEVKWPFPGDPWGGGKAYRCRAVDCGAETQLFLRAKIGLCNCSTGIENDADLERMGDLYLFGRVAVPHSSGRPITVGHMNGRLRAYALSDSHGAAQTAILVGYNDRCDMVAATAIVRRHQHAIEATILQFLNSGPSLRWAETALGL